jgi:hypothetical protein
MKQLTEILNTLKKEGGNGRKTAISRLAVQIQMMELKLKASN